MRRRSWRKIGISPDRRARLWEQQALCGEDPDLFYSTVPAKIQAAKRICATCPVQARCREKADRVEAPLSRQNHWGVWAGETPVERFRRRAASRITIVGTETG